MGCGARADKDIVECPICEGVVVEDFDKEAAKKPKKKK
jgi:hypothetical protein